MLEAGSVLDRLFSAFYTLTTVGWIVLNVAFAVIADSGLKAALAWCVFGIGQAAETRCAPACWAPTTDSYPT